MGVNISLVIPKSYHPPPKGGGDLPRNFVKALAKHDNRPSYTELRPIEYFFPTFLGGTGVSPVRGRLKPAATKTTI